MAVARFVVRLPFWTLAAPFIGLCVLGLVLAWHVANASATPTCTIYWTGQTTNDWGTTNNWSLSNGGTATNRLPGRTDFVCMSTSPGHSTVDLSSSDNSAQVAGIDWPNASGVTPTLDVESGGSLTIGTSNAADASTFGKLEVSGTVNTNASVSATTLDLPSGDLSGSGTFVIPTAGTFALSGGELAEGIQVVNDGSAKVAQSASVSFTDNSEIENAGTLALADNSDLNDNAGTGWVINEASGTVSFAGSATSSSSKLTPSSTTTGQ